MPCHFWDMLLNNFRASRLFVIIKELLQDKKFLGMVITVSKIHTDAGSGITGILASTDILE